MPGYRLLVWCKACRSQLTDFVATGWATVKPW
jgi:hypothetical protein